LRGCDLIEHPAELPGIAGLKCWVGQLFFQPDDPAVNGGIADLDSLAADQLAEHRCAQADHGREPGLGDSITPEQSAESISPILAVHL
jgi:hypothetical protein